MQSETGVWWELPQDLMQVFEYETLGLITYLCTSQSQGSIVSLSLFLVNWPYFPIEENETPFVLYYDYVFICGVS